MSSSEYEKSEAGEMISKENNKLQDEKPSKKVVTKKYTHTHGKLTHKKDKSGVVYLSKIPRNMQPANVRSYFSEVGEVGRIHMDPKSELIVIPIFSKFSLLY